MIERDELARRLELVLSETPESARDLMARAGLSAGRRIAGVVTVALLQLKREGKARSHGTRPHIKWTRVEVDEQAERLPLARLDATVILSTTTRTTAGGTRRTELAAVVELGPSWPPGTTLPPRWSAAFSDAQVASGAVTGARTNALSRTEAHLRALRTDKTLPLLPTEDRMTNRPNPLLLPSQSRAAFFSYLASVQPDGARRDSACTRLATLGLATTTAEAEAWLDEAVEQGLLAKRTKRAGDGTVIVRYLPVEPTTPAPLPKSSAPAEELPAGKPLPAPKVTPKKAPPKPRPAPVVDEDTGDPTDDEGALDDPAEHDSEDPPEVESGEVARLTSEVAELSQARDFARGQIFGLESLLRDAVRERDELKVEGDLYFQAIQSVAPHLRGASPRHMAAGLDEMVRDLRDKAQRLEQERDELARVLNRGSRPTTYQGDPAEQFATSIAGWLVSLSDDTWLEVTRARSQLAESKRLREQSHSLELHALDALDRAVGARPAAPAPAPAPVVAPEPEPTVEATAQSTPEPPASGEQANDQGEGGTMRERVRRIFEGAPDETLSAPMVAERLSTSSRHVSPSLTILTRQGVLEKPAYGKYRLARKGRRAA